MQLKTIQLKKLLFLVMIGFILSSVSVKHAFARENESFPTTVTIGKASWYHDKFSGRKTANGEIFNQKKFTCASNHYPLGTWLRITNIKNGMSVIVKVNDRMHPRMKRIVDLTRSAAQKIGIEKSGIGKVTVESFGKTKPEITI